jgi:ABC-type sugar transport system permease subunit
MTIETDTAIPATSETTLSRWTPRRLQAAWGYFFMTPWFFGFLIFIVGPMVASLYLSMTNYSIKTGGKTEFIGLDNYEALLDVRIETEEKKSEEFPVYSFQRPGESEAKQYAVLKEAEDSTLYISVDDPDGQPFEVDNAALESREPAETVEYPVYHLPAYDEDLQAVEGRAREHVLIQTLSDGQTIWLDQSDQPVTFPNFPAEAQRAAALWREQRGGRH